MLHSFRRQRERAAAARRLYELISARARAPALYTECAVPDTVAGRFEMIALHAFVVMRRLKSLAPDGPALGQALHDVMFADLDVSLRELGVGDLGVSKKIKLLASNFYGRIAAYEEGLAGSDAVLAAALARNVYADDYADARADTRAGAPAGHESDGRPPAAALARLAAYLRRAAAALDEAEPKALLAGSQAFAALNWPDPGGEDDG